MVADVNMMLVPDPTTAAACRLGRITQAFCKMKQRGPLQFLSERRLRTMAYTSSGRAGDLDHLSDLTELHMSDRRELDDAVLEMIGVDSAQSRQQLIDELYAHLGDFYEAIRQKEQKAITNKGAARRRERLRPADIAAQIYKEISDNDPELLRQYETHFFDKTQPFHTYDLPASGDASPYSDMLVEHAVEFVKGTKTRIALIAVTTESQAQLLALLANAGIRGLVRVPHEEAVCAQLENDCRRFIEHRDARLRELVCERTADEDIQEKTLSALRALLTR